MPMLVMFLVRGDTSNFSLGLRCGSSQLSLVLDVHAAGKHLASAEWRAYLCGWIQLVGPRPDRVTGKEERVRVRARAHATRSCAIPRE